MTFLSRVLATSILALGPSLAMAETNLIFNSFLPKYDELYQTAIAGFAADIERESGGAITITIPETTLAPSDRQYEMVRDGIADMAIVSSGAVRQLVVLNQIADLPLHSPSSRAGSIALWETYQKYFASFEEFAGVHVLSTSVLPGRQVLNVGATAIEGADGFSGIKLWSPPGRLTGVAKGLGAVPVNSEFTDLYEYVSKGTVDSVIMTPGSAAGARIIDNVTQLVNVPGGLGSLSFTVFISQERWESLTDDERAAIERAAAGLPERSGAAADAAEAEVAPQVADVPAYTFEGEEMAKLDAVFAASLDEWMAAARERGLENPEEVVAFYRSVLDRELAKPATN